MNKYLKILLAVLFALSLSVFIGISGCEKEGPLEEAGEEIDKSVEDAGEKTGEAIEKAGDDIEDATERK